MPLFTVGHIFNTSPRENFVMGGESSMIQSHSEIHTGRITILNGGRGKSQWLAVLLLRSLDLTLVSLSELFLIMLTGCNFWKEVLLSNYLYYKALLGKYMKISKNKCDKNYKIIKGPLSFMIDYTSKL